MRRAISAAVRAGIAKPSLEEAPAERRVLYVVLPELDDGPPVGLLLQQTLHPSDGQAHLRGRLSHRQAAALDEPDCPAATGAAGRARAVGMLLAPVAHRFCVRCFMHEQA